MDETIAYLDAKHYAYDEPFPARKDSLVGQLLPGISPDTLVIYANTGPNTRWLWQIFEGELEMFFILDSDHRLDRVLFWKTMLGP